MPNTQQPSTERTSLTTSSDETSSPTTSERVARVIRRHSDKQHSVIRGEGNSIYHRLDVRHAEGARCILCTFIVENGMTIPEPDYSILRASVLSEPSDDDE